MNTATQLNPFLNQEVSPMPNAEDMQKELIERLLKSTEERWQSDLSLSACCCSEDRNANS